MSLRAFLSPSGTIGRGPFLVAAALVYGAGFAAQGLLGGEILKRAGIWPFLLAGLVLIWLWYALHARRLRGGRRGAGLAAGIAALDVLTLVLLSILLALFLPPPGQVQGGELFSSPGLAWLYLVFYMLGALGAQSTEVIGLVALICAPLALSVALTVFAASLPERAR